MTTITRATLTALAAATLVLAAGTASAQFKDRNFRV